MAAGMVSGGWVVVVVAPKVTLGGCCSRGGPPLTENTPHAQGLVHPFETIRSQPWS